MEDDEVEICRVCRSEGTPEDPLFYPCKCSGSIKYVHQDCLIQWLSHSKKKYCELCKHPFTFTPIYDPTMPENIPFLLFLKRIPLRIFSAIQTWIRALFVAFMWLIFLPYVTVWMVRFYFWLGDVLAFVVSGEEALFAKNQTLIYTDVVDPSNNSTATLLLDAFTNQEASEFYRDLASNFLTDCFEGQIITCVIVVLFVTGFLIREWILQNGPVDIDGLENNNNIREFQPPAVPMPPPPPPMPELRDEHIDDHPRPPVYDIIRDPFELNQQDNRRQNDQNIRNLPTGSRNVFGEENNSFSFSFVPPNAAEGSTQEQDNIDSILSESSISNSAREGQGPSRPDQTAMSSMSIESNSASGSSMEKGKSKSPSSLFTSDILTWESLFKSSLQGKSFIDWTLVDPILFMKPFGEAKNGLTEEQIHASQIMRETMTTQKLNGLTSIFPSDILVWEQLILQPQNDDDWIQVDPQLFMKPFGSVKTGFSPEKLEQISRARASIVTKFLTREFGREHFEMDSSKVANSPGLRKKKSVHFNLSNSTDICNTTEALQLDKSESVPDTTLDEDKFTHSDEQSGSGSSKPVANLYNEVLESSPIGHAEDGQSKPVNLELSNSLGTSSEQNAVELNDEPVEDLLKFEDGTESHSEVPTSISENLEKDESHELPSNIIPSSTELEIAAESLKDIPVVEDTDDEKDEHVDLIDKVFESTQDDVIEAEDDDENHQEPEELNPIEDPQVDENEEHVDAAEPEGVEQGGIFQHIRNWVENLEDDEQVDRVDENGANEQAVANGVNANNGGDIPIAEGNAGDDLDGVLEAIGMRGPFWMLFQNSLLMVVLISLCLSLAVCLPYSIGKTVILIKPLNVISLPIRILRYVTDPLIDFLLDTMFPWLCGGISGLVSRFIQPLFSSFMDISQYLDSLSEYGGASHKHLSTLWEAMQSTLSSDTAADARSQSLLEYWFQDSSISQSCLEIWNNLAFGTSYFYKMSTVGVGYLVLGLSAMWYLARTENMYGQNVVRAARRTIQLAGSCLKVIFFIVIELILFPIICGYLLDISTLPVFPEATISSRWMFQRQSPITSIFLHWFAGTGFMFHFSVFIAQCRKVVRPGVMWFIRDPNDPQFHPMREILERSVFTQLRKIAISGLMYMGMILLGLGTVVYTVGWASSIILPLRLDLSAAVSSIPIDLLVYHLVIPLTLNSTRPKRLFTALFDHWWRITSRFLRLTSFMFGNRQPTEEYTLVFKSWWSELRWFASTRSRADAVLKGDAQQIKDGGFLRVPNFDSAPLNPQRRMLIPVEEDGTPIDHADTALLNDSNTNIVYAPPNFNYRLILFLFLMWLSGSIFGCSLLITPLLVGRFILGKLMHNFSIIHDGYSFFAGLYFIWGCLLALEWTLRKVVAYYNWNGDFDVFKRTCKDYVITFFKLVYVFITLGVIIPCLMSLAVQLYVVYPLLNRQPSRIPVFLLQNWAIGVIYAKIAYQLVFILPENRWSRAINQITQGRGLRNPDIKAITKSLILPIGGTALIAVLAPAFFAYATERYQGSTEVLANSDTYRLAYPLTLVIVTCYFVQKKSISLYHQWMGSIRDEEYVIGRKLENFQRVSKIDSISNHEPEVSTVAKEDQDSESDESDEYNESEPLLGNTEANSDPSNQSTSAGPSDFAQAHSSEPSPVQSHGQSTTEPALVQED